MGLFIGFGFLVLVLGFLVVFVWVFLGGCFVLFCLLNMNTNLLLFMSAYVNHSTVNYLNTANTKMLLIYKLLVLAVLLNNH